MPSDLIEALGYLAYVEALYSTTSLQLTGQLLWMENYVHMKKNKCGLWGFLYFLILSNSTNFSLTFHHQKLDFANNVQLSLTLAALSLGLWWTFDRSRSGLGLGITIAFLATLITQLLVYNGVYQ